MISARIIYENAPEAPPSGFAEAAIWVQQAMGTEEESEALEYLVEMVTYGEAAFYEKRADAELNATLAKRHAAVRAWCAQQDGACSLRR